jgi:GNAT superfamily N-acetyltransferase
VILFKEVSEDNSIVVVEYLARQIWVEHFEPVVGMAQVEYMLNKFQSADAIRQYLAQGYKYYVVDLDGIAVGYVAFLPKIEAQELFLSKFYLLLMYRGRGLGREMMEFVRKFAGNNNLSKIKLNTNKKNVDPICFYEKFGFVKKEDLLTDFGAGFVGDDWLMEMVL